VFRAVVDAVTVLRLLPGLARRARQVALVHLQRCAVQVSTLMAVPRHQPESGQGTVEYALVLLGAAAVALLLVAWVARTDLVGRLFDTVVGKILGRA
jgi:hypothetical protein